MSVQSQRGRKVEARKRNNPLLIFYIAIGAVLLVGIVFLITAVLRTNTGVSAINAPVGRTTEGFYYKGNPEAAVKVIAFEDFQCPACAFYNKNLHPLVTRDYIDSGKIQFIFHEFPLDIHANAIPAAAAARCAGDQNQFWQMHDMLFINQGQWAQLASPVNTFSSYAGQLGLDRATFDSCMSANTYAAEVNAAAQSSVAAGAQATPTFSVNGQLVDSAGLVAAIDNALRASGQ